MAWQVIFKDEQGHDIISPKMDDKTKESYVKNLGEIPYTIKEVEDKKWQLAGIVFDIQLIPAARKAIREKKQMKGLYTFGDPKELAVKDKLCKVECTTAEQKVGYVVGVFRATANEIKLFKASIGYAHLGLVIESI